MADFMNSFVGTMQSQPAGFAPRAPTSGATVFSGISSVLGGLSDISRGRSEEAQLDLQAQQFEDEASQEELAGRDQVIQSLRRLNQERAQMIAAGGASGVAGQGSLFSSFEQAEDIGRSNEVAIRTNTNIRSSQLRGQAEQTRFEGDQARAAGRIKAGGRFLEYFGRLARRG